jgi:hypothetical protein
MKLRTLILLACSQLPIIATAAPTASTFDFSALTQLSQTHAQGEHKGCAHKPGAEVFVSGREFFYLQRGQMENLAVDLTGIKGQELRIELSAESKGLALQGPQQVQLQVDEHHLASFNVPVKALLDGRWTVNLVVHSQTAEGEVAARALALVVQVGNMVSSGGGQQKPTQTDAQGAPMIVLPAQEEIL